MTFTVFLWLCLTGFFIYIVRDFPSFEQWKKILSFDKVPGFVFLSFSIVFVMILRGVRWWGLLKTGFSYNMAKLIIVFGWCFILSSFSPMRTGELFRIHWIRRLGGSGSLATGVLFAERLLDFLILMILLEIITVLSVNFTSSIATFSLSCLAVTTLVYAALSLFSIPIKQRLNKRLMSNIASQDKERFSYKIKSKILLFFQGVATLGAWRNNLQAVVLTLIIWGALSCGFYFYLQSFFPGIEYTASLSVLILVNLSSLLGITPGNIGVYEMAGIIALKPFGISAGDAFVAVVGLHAIVTLVTLIYGLFCKMKLNTLEQHF